MESTPPKAPDSNARLASAVESLVAEVRVLARKVGVQDANLRMTNQSIRALRAAHAALDERTSDLEDRTRRELDDEKVDALVISIEEARKLSKKALERIEDMERAAKENADETKAQTPVLAKVDDQTKAMSVPTKAAAIINLAIGLVWLVVELVKAIASKP